VHFEAPPADQLEDESHLFLKWTLQSTTPT